MEEVAMSVLRYAPIGLVSSALFAAAFLGCGRDEGPPARDADLPELVLFCGAGIRPPVAEAIDAFAKENRVRFAADYAGSEVLLAKIKLGQQGDVYVPGDADYVERAAKDGLILSRQTVCYSVPTILVQKGNPKGIKALSDLTRPGIRVGLGDPKACAVGQQTRRILQKSQVPWPDVEKNLKFQSLTVNELGIQIQMKSLDAVIVWDATAACYTKAAEQVAIPADQNIISTVEASVLKFTKHRQMAEKFLQFLVSDRGKGIFKKHDYRVEPPG
jgi:molybdate transport system substrate-binding protein